MVTNLLQSTQPSSKKVAILLSEERGIRRLVGIPRVQNRIGMISLDVVEKVLPTTILLSLGPTATFPDSVIAFAEILGNQRLIGNRRLLFDIMGRHFVQE